MGLLKWWWGRRGATGAEVEAEAPDEVEALKAANAKLLEAKKVAEFNYRKFRRQWEEAQKKLRDHQEECYPVLQRYGLLSELGWSLFLGDVPARLCAKLVASRRSNRELRRANRLLRSESDAERRSLVDVAIREIRAERHRWFPPPEEDVVEVLLAKVKKLKRALHFATEGNHQRNLELDGLHYVWCDGGCGGGVDRYGGDAPPLTREMVTHAVRNVRRMVRWWNSARYREGLRGEEWEEARVRWPQ